MKATTPPYLGADVFYNTNEELVIYVPMESLEAYKTSGNWSAYADKIQYKFTEGLAYSLNTDGASYSVTGIGTATDTGVVIPSSYLGLPVTQISAKAFYNNNKLTGIVIPESVTIVDKWAFSTCDKLTQVIFQGKPDSINGYAFGGAQTDIYVPWAEGEVANAPWGATNATIHYNSEV